MKILICISQLKKGGAERVTSNLANYLSQKNEVSIGILRNIGIEYDLQSNIEIINFETIEQSNKPKILKYVYRYKNIKKKLSEKRYDIILTFLPEASFMILLFQKKFNLNVIVSVRNDPKVEYKKYSKKILMKWLYKRANGFVFQTSDAQKYFSSKIQQKGTIIMNSISDKFMIEQAYGGIRQKVIVSVGRLCEQKNQIMLLKVFKQIINKYPNYSLIIYGDGDKRNELEQYIQENGMQENVMLPGIVNEIEKEIYKASMFVLTSNFEGMPNSLIEAMCLGIPCISTDCPCGGPKEIIQDGENGFLIEVNNHNQLAEKMELLITNKKLAKKISVNAHKIIEKVSPDKINKEWEEYLKSKIKQQR